MKEAQFISRIENILQYNSTFRVNDREQSGKISLKRLGRYPSQHIFTKVSQENFKDKCYYISILVDASGSIFNSNLQNLVRDSVENLQKTFSEIPQIKYEIIIFGQTDIVLKKFSDKRMLRAEFDNIYNADYLWKLSVVLEEQSSGYVDIVEYNEHASHQSNSFPAENNDPLYIHRCLERNKNLEKNQHIILVLSDGSPTSNDGYSRKLINPNKQMMRGLKKDFDLAFTKTNSEVKANLSKVVRQCKVPIIGIGIKVDYVKDIYPYWCIVSNEVQLYQGIIKHLSRLIKKYAY